MSSLRKKTVFTPEQRASLEAAYSDGLVSTGAANSAAIGTLAEELQLDVSLSDQGTVGPYKRMYVHIH